MNCKWSSREANAWWRNAEIFIEYSFYLSCWMLRLRKVLKVVKVVEVVKAVRKILQIEKWVIVGSLQRMNIVTPCGCIRSLSNGQLIPNLLWLFQSDAYLLKISLFFRPTNSLVTDFVLETPPTFFNPFQAIEPEFFEVQEEEEEEEIEDDADVNIIFEKDEHAADDQWLTFYTFNVFFINFTCFVNKRKLWQLWNFDIIFSDTGRKGGERQ